MRSVCGGATARLGAVLLAVLAAAPAGMAAQGGAPLSLTIPQAPGQPDPELDRISRSLARLAERLRPALVQVRRAGVPAPVPPGPPHRGDGPDAPRPRRGLGSGFIVSPQGHIVTNHHVIRGATTIHVRLHDGRRFTARPLGWDARTDLAVLKIDGVTDLPALPLGNSDALRVGELVMALGNPFGLEESVSVGIVSRAPRPGATGPGFQFIQTDAAVNPGNSGGPLVNMAGEVVGVTSAANSRGSVGFAVPSRVVQLVVPALAAAGKMRWGWLGVAMGDPEEGRPGALIRTVRSGEPADRAGLQAGDVVVEVDGRPIGEPRDLQQVIASLAPGKMVPVQVMRDGRREVFSVEIGEAPDEVQ